MQKRRNVAVENFKPRGCDTTMAGTRDSRIPKGGRQGPYSSVFTERRRRHDGESVAGVATALPGTGMRKAAVTRKLGISERTVYRDLCGPLS